MTKRLHFELKTFLNANLMLILVLVKGIKYIH